MPTTVATALVSGGAAAAAALAIEQLRARFDQASPALVIAFASTSQPLDALLPPLVEAFPGAVVLGSSSSGEFTRERDAKDSVAVFAVAGDFRVFAGLGEGLQKNPEGAISKAIDGQPFSLEGYAHRTAILLLDPLAGVSEEATLMLAALLEDLPIAGGAAGDDLKMTRTTVGLGTHVATDAALVATIFSKAPLGVGVRHGHAPLSQPLTVTRSEGATVFEVDGRPAWDVWAEATRTSAATRGVDPDTLPADALGGYLLRYEAGLATGSDYKIRAPLSRHADGSLGFACGIPEGARIQITESVPERQIDSARAAARQAREAAGGDVAGAVVFDCICRNLILGDQFHDAVRGISEELGGVPLAGFETYGEIALAQGEMSGFHNTTTVVLTFPR